MFYIRIKIPVSFNLIYIVILFQSMLVRQLKRILKHGYVENVAAVTVSFRNSSTSTKVNLFLFISLKWVGENMQCVQISFSVSLHNSI